MNLWIFQKYYDTNFNYYFNDKLFTSNDYTIIKFEISLLKYKK